MDRPQRICSEGENRTSNGNPILILVSQRTYILLLLRRQLQRLLYGRPDEEEFPDGPVDAAGRRQVKVLPILAVGRDVDPVEGAGGDA